MSLQAAAVFSESFLRPAPPLTFAVVVEVFEVGLFTVAVVMIQLFGYKINFTSCFVNAYKKTIGIPVHNQLIVSLNNLGVSP